MSDRYETPSWDDEPSDLGVVKPLATEPETPSGDLSESPLDSEPAGPDDGLDAASENVLEGWPLAASTAPGEKGPAESSVEETPGEGRFVADTPVVEETARVPVESPPAEIAPVEPAPIVVAPVEAPLADHLSTSSEHAPGELTVPPGYSVLEGRPHGERRAVGVVVSRFNGDVTSALLASALDELEARGVARESVTVMPVPGAFELPLASMALAKTRRFACIVALGCVIRGDTPHFDYVSSEAASGLQLAGIETGVPVAFGVLTLDRADQAASRSTKGAEAVQTALEMADLFANLRAAAAR